MTRLIRVHLLVCMASAFGLSLAAQDRPPFRTDADGPVLAGSTKTGKSSDGKPSWYQVVDGEFPPEGSAHAISGELIWVDHLERRFHLRVDRNDAQDRSVWDLPLDAFLLPYGSISYHGAPAALQDLPLGTHLHGLFYLRSPADLTPPPDANNNRKTPEVDFRRCFQLEDDFSFRARQGQLWTIETVDAAGKKLTAVLEQDGKPIGKPHTFDLLTSTRVWNGRSAAAAEDLHPGQHVLFNLTWATLYGPGRLTDLWIDGGSRELATRQQLERHRNHIRERGLPGWVTAVDDDSQIVTITFFGGVDPSLFDELTWTNPEPFGWPLSKPEAKPLAPKGTIAVARDCLMTHDPVNDRKGGNILDVQTVPVEPGSSGVRIKVQCDMLLEGYRPRRVVRFYTATRKVEALPREEQFFGRE